MANGLPVEARALSTGAIPRGLRVKAFREFIVRLVGVVDVELVEDDRPFRSRATVFELPDVGLAFGTMSDCDMRYSRAMRRAHDDKEIVALTLLTRGSLQAVQYGREASLGGNGLLVYTAPSQMRVRNGCESATVFLPRARVREALPAFDPAKPLALSGDPARSGAVRQLALYLGIARRSPKVLSAAYAQIMADHLFDLSVLALGAGGEAGAAAWSRGGMAARAQRVLRETDARVADPGLSLAAIANRLGLPEAEVRGVFDATGDAFGDRLEARRLDLAMQRLRNPDWSDRSIDDIARLSGFADPDRFRRRFAARFGDGPAAFRGKSLN